MRRNWIKVYVDQCLRGTMFNEMEDPAERFVWFGFLLLAGDSPFEGKIALTENIGYMDAQLGSLLKCDEETIKVAKIKMIKYAKIKVLDNNIIQICNWQKYQSEYKRQRPYREEKKLQDEVTSKSNNEKLPIEREGDIERDKKENNKKEETLSPTEKEILKELKEVKNYPCSPKKTIEYIRSKLVPEFPDLDILEEIKKKCTWWIDHPLNKKSSPHAQIRNWLIKAREFQAESRRGGRVGGDTTRERVKRVVEREKQTKPQERQTKPCPECGVTLFADEIDCPHCGQQNIDQKKEEEK